MGRTVFAAGLMLAVAVAWSSPAGAHKVVLSVYVTGALIEGEVGFSNGDMAPGAVIQVFGPDGTALRTVTTDADGFFAFDATARVDHVLKADLGAGHIAEARVAANELPATLGAPGLAAAAAEIGDVTGTTGEAISSMAMTITPAELEAMIQGAVASQVRPLRQQLTALETRIRWTDILGGLGYILGLTGLVAYGLARRRTREEHRSDPTAVDQ